jgi:hypothetical protein
VQVSLFRGGLSAAMALRAGTLDCIGAEEPWTGTIGEFGLIARTFGPAAAGPHADSLEPAAQGVRPDAPTRMSLGAARD